MHQVAGMAGVSPSTVSSAVRARHLNIRTATRIARVVASHPIIHELEAWGDATP